MKFEDGERAETDHLQGATNTAIHQNRPYLQTVSSESDLDLNLVEFHIASRGPRVGTLVRFARNELLPKEGLAEQTDLFLTL